MRMQAWRRIAPPGFEADSANTSRLRFAYAGLEADNPSRIRDRPARHISATQCVSRPGGGFPLQDTRTADQTALRVTAAPCVKLGRTNHPEGKLGSKTTQKGSWETKPPQTVTGIPNRSTRRQTGLETAPEGKLAKKPPQKATGKTKHSPEGHWTNKPWRQKANWMTKTAPEAGWGKKPPQTDTGRKNR